VKFLVFKNLESTRVQANLFEPPPSIEMRYVAAYMLATLGGNQNPSVADVKKILGSVGIEVNEDQAQGLISKLDGKSVDSVHARMIFIQ